MKLIAIINLMPFRLKALEDVLEAKFKIIEFNAATPFIEYNTEHPLSFHMVIFCADIQDSNTQSSIHKTIPYIQYQNYPVILLSERFTFNNKKTAVKEGISGIFEFTDINNNKFIGELN